MKSNLFKGDVVIIYGKVLHIRKDGGVDIKIGRNQIAFNVDPNQVGLVVDRDEVELEEEDHDWVD